MKGNGCITRSSRRITPAQRESFSETLSTLSEDKTMQADLSRLTKVCCAPKKLPALDGAPLPTLIESSVGAACWANSAMAHLGEVRETF